MASNLEEAATSCIIYVKELHSLKKFAPNDAPFTTIFSRLKWRKWWAIVRRRKIQCFWYSAAWSDELHQVVHRKQKDLWLIATKQLHMETSCRTRHQLGKLWNRQQLRCVVRHLYVNRVNSQRSFICNLLLTDKSRYPGLSLANTEVVGKGRCWIYCSIWCDHHHYHHRKPWPVSLAQVSV